MKLKYILFCTTLLTIVANAQEKQIEKANDKFDSYNYEDAISSYEELIAPVNSLLHTTGLKNFADLEIISQSKTSFTSGDSQSSPLIDIISKKRTDDISNYDLSVDYDVTDNISKFIRFKNRLCR